MATKATGLLAKLATALGAARDDIGTIRDQRLTLLDSIAQVETAPADDGEIAARVDAVLDRAEAQARDVSLFSALGGPDARSFDIDFAMQRQPLGVLCLLGQRETIADRLIAEAVATRKGQPMTAAERGKTLAKLRAEVRALEIEEERAIRSAEAAGARISRREDVDPEILLATDEALS